MFIYIVFRVEQVRGGKNGSTFEGAIYGREHYIVYEATDSDGLKDSCYFSFTVTGKNEAYIDIMHCTNIITNLSDY